MPNHSHLSESITCLCDALCPQVAMGGARSKFFPRNVTDPVEPTQRGDRADGRNLVEVLISGL